MQDVKYKVGDKVVFAITTGSDERGDIDWESDYGLEIGDVVRVCEVEANDIWVMSKTGQTVCTKPSNVLPFVEEQEVKLNCSEMNKETSKQPIKSDGGSSSYYFTKLPVHVIDQIVITGGIEVKDFVRYCLDNDADCKDIVKALKRICEFKKGGGKEGVDAMYDATKIKFFANELYEQIKQEQGDQG